MPGPQPRDGASIKYSQQYAFVAAWTEGQALLLEQAVTLALEAGPAS